MFNIRQKIKNDLESVGLSAYKFCKGYGFELSNFAAYLRGGNTLSVDKIEKIIGILDGLTAQMPIFTFNILFQDGTELNARVTAQDGDKATERLINLPQMAIFIQEHGEVVKATLQPDGVNTPPNPDDYLLQDSTEKPGWWVVTDIKNNVVIQFQEGNFNAAQKNTVLYDTKLSEVELATIERKIADYLIKYHYKIL